MPGRPTPRSRSRRAPPPRSLASSRASFECCACLLCLPGPAGEPVVERGPQLRAALAGAARGDRGCAGVEPEQRIDAAERERAASPAQSGRRAAAARERPAARVGRSQAGSRAPGAARQRDGAPRRAVIGLEERDLRVGVDAGAGEQPPLGPDQREVAARGGRAAGGQLGLAEADHVLRQRQPGGQHAPAADRSAEVPAGRVDPREAGLRRRVPGHGRERGTVRRPRRRRPPARQLDAAEQRMHRGRALARRSAGVDRAPHRGGRAGEVAVQLAQVGDAGVAGQRRLGVDHPLQHALGGAEAAELDERVDERRIRCERARPRRASAPREPQRATEVVAREREPGARDERVRVAGAPRKRRAQQLVGARVEARVADLARLLQVRGRERDARGDVARSGARGGLQPRDLRVGGRGRSRRRGRRRAERGRRVGAAQQDERRERRDEAEEDGDESSHGRRGLTPRRARGQTGWVHAGGWGTGAWAGSTRLSFESNPESGSATYGNAPRNGLSLTSTPSPSGICLPPSSGLSRAPAITRSSMSTTSSFSRRPFGNPAVSPASTPKRLGLALGGTPRLTFSVSAGTGFEPNCVSPGTPVNSAWTMSVRSVSFTPRSNRAFSSRAGSGASAPAPKFAASFAGEVRLNLSLRPIGMITSLISGLPSRLTWTQRLCTRRLPLWRSTLTFLRSVLVQTPTTALEASGPDTLLRLRVTSDSGTCSANECVL